MTAEIQAFDDPAGTIYRLRRDGCQDVFADWPHPLHELAPDAVRLPSVGPGMEQSHGRIIMLGVNLELLHDAPTVRESDWMPEGAVVGLNEEVGKTWLGDHNPTILPGWTAYDTHSAKRPWTRRGRKMLDERIPGR